MLDPEGPLLTLEEAAAGAGASAPVVVVVDDDDSEDDDSGGGGGAFAALAVSLSACTKMRSKAATRWGSTPLRCANPATSREGK